MAMDCEAGDGCVELVLMCDVRLKYDRWLMY